MIWLLLIIAAAWFLAYQSASLAVWTIAVVAIQVLLTEFSQLSIFTLIFMWAFLSIILILLNVVPLRRFLISRCVLTCFKKVMPNMSRTEKEALAAGDVTWEGELFAGRPDWDKLLKQPAATLSKEDKAFLDGPAETLSAMIDDWDITHNLTDMPKKMWDFIKKEKFFGMIIPKSYGGLELSEWGHANVLVKLYSRSASVATTVSVPNSLGPAELLLKYGTDEQKDYYLPRLASGKEIPCFALTGPTAGSDAASIPDTGIVCKGTYKGKTVTGIKLNFDKRYITLAPVATIVGLAFRLLDPDHLLSDVEDVGITCVLLPHDTKGVEIGRRQFPLNTAFMNGPVRGKNVFIPVDMIIGGPDMAGQGWRMLMECLCAGRGISLPSGGVGGAKGAALLTGAYARIRKQFNLPLGYFEGIEEPLARIAGYTYVSDATLRMTAAAIDDGAKPAVASAITKYHCTELLRKVINDAMDIHGGKGICLGPNNYLGRGYQSIPIGITVEGANILTRTMIIFGQGMIRCHPYVYDVVESAEQDDLIRFDKAVFSHLGYTVTTKLRAWFLALSAGYFVKVKKSPVKRYFQLLTRYAAALAYISEVAMIVYGAQLKRREKITGRLADVLSYLYQGSAVLKRFADDGYPKEDLVLVRWVCRDLLYKIQFSLDHVIKNFPNKYVGWAIRVIVFPLGRHSYQPSDAYGKKVAKLLLTPSATRTRIGEGAHITHVNNNPIGALEDALEKVIAAEDAEKRLRKLFPKDDPRLTLSEKLKQALKDKKLSKQDVKLIEIADEARSFVIAVDDFDDDELRR